MIRTIYRPLRNIPKSIFSRQTTLMFSSKRSSEDDDDDDDKLIKNESITFPSLRVVFDEEQQKLFGIQDKWKIMTRDEALMLAKYNKFDLLLVNETSTPPVCKLGFGFKVLQEQRVKEKEQRSKLKAHSLKEVTIGALIDNHDLTHKMTKCKDFLMAGHTVKVCIAVKPRELRKNPTCVDETCLKVFDLLEGHVSSLNTSKLIDHRKEFMLYPKARPSEPNKSKVDATKSPSS